VSPSPICILYSQDPDLVRRLKAFVSALAQVRHVSGPDRLDAVLQQTGPALLLLDLRAKEARDLLEQIKSGRPEVLIVALGASRSEPLREAEQSDIYAAEDWHIDRRSLQALVSRGFEYLRVLQ
jgi:CheY-like chemotaxis protein